MKTKELKTLIDFCKDLQFNPSEYKEVYNEMQEDNEDFEVSDYRFIHTDAIDQILKEELSSDTYILGCFNDWFLSDCSGLNIRVIQALQKAEAYEELGELMLEHIEEIASEYSRLDGYGHHFAHYDHETNEILDYYVFRLN